MRERERGMEKQHFPLSKTNPSEDNDTVGSVVSQASNHSAGGKVENYMRGCVLLRGRNAICMTATKVIVFHFTPFLHFRPVKGSRTLNSACYYRHTEDSELMDELFLGSKLSFYISASVWFDLTNQGVVSQLITLRQSFNYKII